MQPITDLDEQGMLVIGSMLLAGIVIACAAIVWSRVRMGAAAQCSNRMLREALEQAQREYDATKQPATKRARLPGRMPPPPWLILPEAIAGHGEPMTEAQAPDTPDNNATFATLTVELCSAADVASVPGATVTTHEEICQ
jgi:type II secretory pathway pseudopilin PulG